MPEKLSSGDRKVLIIAGTAFLLLVIIGFLLAPTNTQASNATTYSTASGGAKAAYLLLQTMGYHVERWQHSATELTSPINTVLVLANAPTVASSKEKAAIERFIAGGGRVITTGIGGASYLPEDSSQFNDIQKNPWSEFPALMPSAITRAAPSITLAPVATWEHGPGIPLYGKEDQNVVQRLPHGKGDAIWLASATPFTNAGIKEIGNLEFLLAALGDKQNTRVLFDEYVHGYGQEDSPEKNHPLMIALLLQSAVLALAAVFTFSRRSGPLRPMPAESRLAPLEFVETLGGLYEQAHAASVAVNVAYERFQFRITRRLGLANNASPEEIDRAVRERLHRKDDSLLGTLQAAVSARYRPDLQPKEALALIRSLYSCATELKLFPISKDLSKERN